MIAFASLLYCVLFMPDSPKWLFAKKRYGEAKEILYGIQEKNGILPEDRVKFDF